MIKVIESVTHNLDRRHLSAPEFLVKLVERLDVSYGQVDPRPIAIKRSGCGDRLDTFFG
jgi:hypothetical protein